MYRGSLACTNSGPEINSCKPNSYWWNYFSTFLKRFTSDFFYLCHRFVYFWKFVQVKFVLVKFGQAKDPLYHFMIFSIKSNIRSYCLEDLQSTNLGCETKSPLYLSDATRAPDDKACRGKNWTFDKRETFYFYTNEGQIEYRR